MQPAADFMHAYLHCLCAPYALFMRALCIVYALLVLVGGTKEPS